MKDKENIQEIIEYILQFLLGTNDKSIVKDVGYTSDKEEFKKYKLIIKPSCFFEVDFYGKSQSLPSLPLDIWEEIPILFGSPLIESVEGTTIIHSDIIASTFFLISRYEEIIRHNVRDEHGRFPGKESLAYRSGFLHRPIVDEYGNRLRKYAREVGIQIQDPPEHFQHIYITHDVDMLSHFRNPRSVLGAILRFYKAPKNTLNAIQTYFSNVNNDPWFTFPWFITLKSKLIKALPTTKIDTIYFIKCGGGNNKEDYPFQNIRNKDYQFFFKLIEHENSYIGLHPSYQAGLYPEFIHKEKELLEKVINKKIYFSRNHYLCNREPKDFNTLIENGLSDDYTMCYADITGFRLGTCKPVRWIDPESQKLTSLRLHHLTILDVTLSEKKYMGLNEIQAFNHIKCMINMVRKNNGELVLLWHNNSVEKGNNSYHRKLYEKVIRYLSENSL